MSRVGNNPILIPDGVNVQINPGEVVVSGKLGTMNQSYDCVVVEQKNNPVSYTHLTLPTTGSV